MQNQQKKLLLPFKTVSSKPIMFLDLIFGLFWVFFVLFFPGGIIFLATNSSEETGLDETGMIVLFFVFLFISLGIIVLLIYSSKKMHTTTIIDEKGIRYLNKFNGRIVKELPWNSFAKKEEFEYFFEAPKYDINSRTPMKSLFDQFSWPVLADGKVVIHIDAFLGKHFFAMFYVNRLELIRGFLLGIAHYRPDLTVDPLIFENHYIDQETYDIDYNQRKRIGIVVLLVCVFILVLLYFLIV